MLSRRFRREGGQTNKTIGQDGFSASVPAVSPRPWHGQEGALPESAGHDAKTPSAPASYMTPAAPAAQVAPAAQAAPARAAAQSYPAYAMVGRRVIDFADNGDGTLTAVRCIDPAADDLDIQFEAGACPVTAIAPKAFEGCTALRRVVIPPTVRQIGEMAFSGCAHLMRVVIPGSVARVGTLAFAKCAELERVRIEPGVQALGPSCFSKCTGLQRVDVPASLSSFGGGVFFGCGRQVCLYGAEETPAQQYAKINGLKFDSQSWKEDEELVFEELENGDLVVAGPRKAAPERIEIPSELCGRKIVAIAPKAFFTCHSLLQLSVGANVREIGENAFFGCHSLATTRVADLAFDGCAPNLRVFGGVSAGRAQMV